MAERKTAKEIKRRILLSPHKRNVSAGDFAAMLVGLCVSIKDSKVGFNHATTDVVGWFSSLAPYGITINDAFVEDMLYGCNMLDELGHFSHPLGKTFQQTLATVLRKDEVFDLDTNSIKQRGK